MARHPTPPRGGRGQDQPDDAFIAAVERFIAWARANQRLLTVAVVAVAILVAGALYYVNYQRSLEAQATGRFAELQQTIASGNTQLAVRDLQAFVNRFGSSGAGEQARLILADLYLTQGQPQPALDVLGNLPRNLRSTHGLPAARLQAAAYEMLGDTDRAVDTYRRVAERARFPFQQREALADAARVRLQAGQPERAATLYARIVDSFDENEPGRGYYEMWLGEARARAEARAPAAATDSVAGS